MRLQLSALSALMLLAACEGAAPTVHKDNVVSVNLPSGLDSGRSFGKSVHALRARSGSRAQDSSSSSSSSGQCAAWTTDVQTYDQATGNYVDQYSCAQGGDIAQVRTTGHDDGAGNGSFTQVYTMRDGSTETWNYTYTSSGLTQTYHGTSNDGSTDDSIYTYSATSTSAPPQVHEVYKDKSGSYVTDGVYGQDGSFNGTESFQDANNSTVHWNLTETQGSDGSSSQVVDTSTGSWYSHYTYDVHADKSSDYVFASDDTTTQVQPDVAGSYHYNSDGSGQGSYRWQYDGGSKLDVNVTFTADGSATQGWSFTDASSGQVTQTGSIHYAPDGSGSGTVTNVVQGGASQTCDVTVSADGTSSVGNCH
jgi:hypothetical protein